MEKENKNKELPKKKPPPSLDMNEEEATSAVVAKKVTLNESQNQVLQLPVADEVEGSYESDDEAVGGQPLPGHGKLTLTKSTIDVLQPTNSEAAALMELQATADLAGDDSNKDVMDSDGRNLIINYLPPSFSEHDVMHYFGPYGIIENCKVVMDLASGKSKGYGFVKYKTRDSAVKAQEALNGYAIKNKHLKVAFARKNCKEIRNSNLYVTHLPKTLTDEGLKDLFKPFGHLIECRVLKDKQGKCRGVGFVRFDSHHNAMKARDALNKKTPDGWTREIRMKLASKRTDYAPASQHPWPMQAPMPPYGFPPQPPYGYYGWPMPPPHMAPSGSPRRRGGNKEDKGKRGDQDANSPRSRGGGVPYGGPYAHYPPPYPYYPHHYSGSEMWGSRPPPSMSPWGPGGHFWGPPPKGRGDRDGAYYSYQYRTGKRRQGGSYFLEKSDDMEQPEGHDRNGYGYPSFYSHYGYTSPRGRQGYTPRSNRGGGDRTVIVSNISEDTTQEELEEAFSRFNVSNVKVITKRSGRGAPMKPHAFLNFDKPDDARSALFKDGYKINGHKIKVQLKTTKPGGGSSYRPS